MLRSFEDRPLKMTQKRPLGPNVLINDYVTLDASQDFRVGVSSLGCKVLCSRPNYMSPGVGFVCLPAVGSLQVSNGLLFS